MDRICCFERQGGWVRFPHRVTTKQIINFVVHFCMKVCSKCKKKKDESEFGKNKSKIDGLQHNCKKCQREYAKKHYYKNENYYLEKAKRRREKIYREINDFIRKEKDKPCIDCGVKYPFYVMDFDHISGEKEFNIGEARVREIKIDRIKKELEKCELVCSNCHRERTWQRNNRGVG